jgi:hypothetical protein
VLTEKELLTPDERIMGRYNAEFASKSGERYIPLLMPLLLLVTNRRVILQPQKRKHYEPASIPGRFISDVQEITLPRQGVAITLQDGRVLNLFVGWGRDNDLISSLRIIASLPPTRDYNMPLSFDHLQKLIDYMESI